MLDKLLKIICKAVNPTLTAALEPLTLCQKVVSISVFYRYCFGRCSSEVKEVAPYSCGMSTFYSKRLSFLNVVRISM